MCFARQVSGVLDRRCRCEPGSERDHRYQHEAPHKSHGRSRGAESSSHCIAARAELRTNAREGIDALVDEQQS
jgi:hypothetical protein